MDKSVLWRQVKGILDNLSAGLKRLEKKIETAGGGADWNANEGEPGHILNKPFGDKTVVTVFPETTIPFNEDASGWVTNVPVTIPPEGTECTVTINGTAHEAALKMLSLEGLSAPVLGNASVLGGEDTGETFFIMMVPPEKSEMAGGMTMQMVLFDGSTDAATVSIEAVSVKKIAYEFMPDGYPRIETSSGVILPETAIIRTGLMDGASEPLKGDIVVGKTYTVNISGTEYQTEAKNAYFAEQNVTLTCLGNLGIFELGADTGEPFIAWVVTPEIADLYENATIVIAGGAISGGGHTISISGEMEAIKEMDARFIKSALSNCVSITEAPGAEPELLSLPVRYSTDGKNFFWVPMSFKHVMAWNLGDYMHDGAIIYCKNSEDWIATGSTFVTVNNNAVDGIVLDSSTSGSQKRFRITVDDSGKISAAEYTAG